MARYWMSWWQNERAKWPDSPVIRGIWCSGHRDAGYEGRKYHADQRSLCAVVDVPNGGYPWRALGRIPAVSNRRFCEPKPGDWTPGDRFPTPPRKMEGQL